MTDRFLKRRNKLRRAIKKADADALLVTNFTNVTYLTGFTGDDSYLLVSGDRDTLVSDFRYTIQIEEECPGLDLEVRSGGTTMMKSLGKLFRKTKPQRLGIEGASMTVSFQELLAKEFPKLELVTTSNLIEKLRTVKDRGEVTQIRQAVRLAEKAFAVIRAQIQPEMTEKQVCDDLEHQMRVFGATCRAFPSIIGVGPRAALPHAKVTDRKVGESDFILIDWGANGPLYKSDLTRVLVTGKISTKLERIYNIVLKAQKKAIQAIGPGVEAKEVDRVARDVISKAGHGRHFGHGLGHGIGLEVHEAPRFGENSKDVLKAGMVVTVEPGIYLPGWGGVRIEDDILVTRTGHEVLSRVSKEFEEMVVQ